MYKFNNVLLHGLLLACLGIMPAFASNTIDERNIQTQNAPNQVSKEFNVTEEGEQIAWRHGGWRGGYRHHFGYYYGRPYYYRPYYYYYPYSSNYYYPYNSYYYTW